LVLGHNSITKDWDLVKFVRLEASTKPHVHQKFEIFWTNITSTMACPNFKNGPKNGLRSLDVNEDDMSCNHLEQPINATTKVPIVTM
jgi:hypothetical protein